MKAETNRVAQLIATAADKHLGVRPDGQPKPQDKAAAEAITEQYLLIPHAELPGFAYIERDGKTHVEVEGSEAGTWSVNSRADTNRKWGLEYIAASIAIEQWNSKQEVLKRERRNRRDALRIEFVGGPTDCTTPSLEKAIDRILEMEGYAA